MAYDLFTTKEFLRVLEEQKGQERVSYFLTRIDPKTLQFYDLPDNIHTIKEKNDPKITTKKKKRTPISSKEERRHRNSVSQRERDLDTDINKIIREEAIPAHRRLMLQMLLIEGSYGRKNKKGFEKLQDDLWEDRELIQDMLRYWFSEERLSRFVTELMMQGDMESPHSIEYQRPGLRVAPTLDYLRECEFEDSSIDQQLVRTSTEMEKLQQMLDSREFLRSAFDLRTDGKRTDYRTFKVIPDWIKESFQWMMDDNQTDKPRSKSKIWFGVNRPTPQSYGDKSQCHEPFFDGHHEMCVETQYFNIPLLILDFADSRRGDKKGISLEEIGVYLKANGMLESTYEPKTGIGIKKRIIHFLDRLVDFGLLARTGDHHHITENGIEFLEFGLYGYFKARDPEDREVSITIKKEYKTGRPKRVKLTI